MTTQTINFVSRLKALSKSDLIALRRSFGAPLAEASGAALSAFYKIFNQDEKKEEAAFLSACAVAFVIHYKEGKMPLWQCLKYAEVSESRVKALISNKYVDRDGFFHSKYSRLIRYVVSKNYFPDINEIHPSLTNWWKYRIDFIKKYYEDENINK